jgi:hypothetical protein
MAVNLSPYGGVGAQFLDNSGNVLTGGKIYTYAGGTTTPQATYTSSNGGTPHSNPIILDASGRVPGGEIWLTDGLVYKFILRDANDVLIATYDGITGINSNFVAFTNQQEIQTATAGQTVFNLTTISYQPGTNSLSVFVDGVNQYGPGASYAYLETDSDTVTFLSGLHVGAEVKFTTSQLNTSGSTNDAFQVSYVPPFTGSTATNVGDKLAQTVSVKDFGAIGNGVANDTAAIQAAIDNSAQGTEIFFPPGTYLITSILTVADADKLTLSGSGRFSVIKKGFNGDMISLGAESTMQNICLDGSGITYTGRGVIVTTGANNNTSWRKFINCEIIDMASYCIEWTAPTSGFKSQVEGGRYLTTSYTSPAFKLPNEIATVGNRTFIGVDTADASFADLGQSQNTAIIGCQGGVPIFSGQPIKTRIVGCRIQGDPTITFDGTDLVIVGNTFGQSTINFASGLTRCRIRNNAFPTATYNDNAGGATSANFIEYGPVTYTPTWTAASTAPFIGNGFIGASYQRTGYDFKVNITWIAGSTTTFGTGAWSFSLPKATSRTTTGSALATDTATGFYSGICVAQASQATVQTLFGENKGNYTTNTIPFTWANTDRIDLDIDYGIAG